MTYVIFLGTLSFIFYKSIFLGLLVESLTIQTFFIFAIISSSFSAGSDKTLLPFNLSGNTGPTLFIGNVEHCNINISPYTQKANQQKNKKTKKILFKKPITLSNKTSKRKTTSSQKSITPPNKKRKTTPADSTMNRRIAQKNKVSIKKIEAMLEKYALPTGDDVMKTLEAHLARYSEIRKFEENTIFQDYQNLQKENTYLKKMIIDQSITAQISSEHIPSIIPTPTKLRETEIQLKEAEKEVGRFKLQNELLENLNTDLIKNINTAFENNRPLASCLEKILAQNQQLKEDNENLQETIELLQDQDTAPVSREMLFHLLKENTELKKHLTEIKEAQDIVIEED